MSPQRVQRKRVKGEPGMPPGAVYVGRPSKWGNPFLISPVAKAFPSLTVEQCQAYAVNDFRTLVDLGEIRVYGGGKVTYPSADEIREALAGRDLACWCPLDAPCHADVLLRIANLTPASQEGGNTRG